MGAKYSAFLQNLLMSVMFINMYIRRGTMEGQSLLLAYAKWIGTLAPTIIFGILDYKIYSYYYVVYFVQSLILSISIF